jgi:hypothetical protein
MLPVWLGGGDLIAADWTGIDARGTWHIYWMFHSHWPHLGDLFHTTLMNHPSGVAFLAPEGLYTDHFLMILCQSVFGLVMGYNAGVFVLLCALAGAVYLLALRFSGSPWASFAASTLILTGHSVRHSVEMGFNYQISALAFAALCLADLPAMMEGSRKAGLKVGLWLGLTTVSYLYYGYLLVVFAVPSALVYLMVIRSTETRWAVPVGWAALVSVLISAAPGLFVLSNIGSISGMQGDSVLANLFPASDPAQYHAGILSVMPFTMDPITLVGEHQVRITVLWLSIIGLWRLPRAWQAFWGAFFLVGILAIWGPYAGLDPQNPDRGIRLPYWLLYNHMPLLWRFRYLIRCLPFVDLCMVVLAARGLVLAPLLLRPSRFWRATVILVFIAGLCEAGMMQLTEDNRVLDHLFCLRRSKVIAGSGEKGRETVAYLESLSSGQAGALVVFPADARILQVIHGLPVLNHRLNYPESSDIEGNPLGSNPVIAALRDSFKKSGPSFQPEDREQLVRFGITHLLVDLSRYQIGQDEIFQQYYQNPVRGSTIVPDSPLQISPERFRRSPLGRRLFELMGEPEEHGFLLVYPLGSQTP